MCLNQLPFGLIDCGKTTGVKAFAQQTALQTIYAEQKKLLFFSVLRGFRKRMQRPPHPPKALRVLVRD